MSKTKRASTKKSTSIKRGRPFRVPLEAVPEPAPVLSFDDFYNALVAVDEILSRCQISYVCWGNTLDVIIGETAKFTEPLQLVTLKNQVTDYARSTLRSLSNPVFSWKDDAITKIILPMGIIKVEMLVLDGSYRPIKNYDLKYFNYDVWKIPNPIEEFNRLMKEIYG
jgi:hypothetical protein